MYRGLTLDLSSSLTSWLAVKELNSNYHNPETMLFHIHPIMVIQNTYLNSKPASCHVDWETPIIPALEPESRVRGLQCLVNAKRTQQ